jgi:hypothetical protein
MTRAEFFVTRGRGHWAKCRVPFLCEREVYTPCGTVECGKRVEKGDVYLTTDVLRYPDKVEQAQRSHTQPERWMNARRRYCAACADSRID